MSLASPGGPRRLYFVNAWVDYAAIGGVSILSYLLLRGLHGGERTEMIWMLAAALAWIVNWPHFAATSYRLYRAPENIRQYPVTALLVPVLVLVAVMLSFTSPLGVAPLLVKLFLFWSPYHFSGQSLGLTLIYARRAGFSIGRWERLAFSGFIFSTFLLQTARFEAGQVDTSFYSVVTPALGLPAWVPRGLTIWMILTGVAVLFFVARWSVRNRRMVPPIILLPAVAQFVWFVPGSTLPSFNEFVPFFHALQYLLIAWVMQLKEVLDARGVQPSRRFVLSETVRWGLFIFAGGVVLFWLLPRVGERFGQALPFTTAVVLSAVQIHHFFVDGVIWKLRNPRMASPLHVNMTDLTSAAPSRQLTAA